MHLQRLYGSLYKTEEDIAWDNVIQILRSEEKEKEEKTNRMFRGHRLYPLSGWCYLPN